MVRLGPKVCNQQEYVHQWSATHDGKTCHITVWHWEDFETKALLAVTTSLRADGRQRRTSKAELKAIRSLLGVPLKYIILPDGSAELSSNYFSKVMMRNSIDIEVLD